MNTQGPDRTSRLSFTPDQDGVIGRPSAPSDIGAAEPAERVYRGYVDNRGRVIYPGLNAPEPENILTPAQQADLKAVGRTVVPAVIDQIALDQLNQESR